MSDAGQTIASGEPPEASKVTIPKIVQAVTALPALAALALGTVAAIAVVAFATDYARLGVGAFALLVGLLTGQEVGVSGGAIFVGRINFAGAAAPFGIMLLTAFALTRLRFTRPWVDNRDLRVRGAAVGGAAMLATALIGKFAANFSSVELDVLVAELTYNVRPLTAIVAGAAVWPLAHYARAAKAADRLLALLVVTIASLSATAAVLGLAFGDEGWHKAAAFFGSLVGGAFYGLNVVAVVFQWPFGGKVELASDFAAESIPFTQLTSMGSGWLWLVPAVVVAALFAAGYLQPVADGWSELVDRTRRFAIYATVLLLPVSVLGDVTAGGDAALFSLGGGQAGRVGLDGLPFRFVLPLLAWSVVVSAGCWFAAQRAGHGWAQTDQLSEGASAVAAAATGLVASAKQAAARAQAAAPSPSGPAVAAAAPTGAGAVSWRDETSPEPAPTKAQVVAEARRLGVDGRLDEFASRAGVAGSADLADATKMARMLALVREAAPADDGIDWSAGDAPTP